MLEHSAKSSGLKEPTNINFLIKETLLLSYHNMKIKNKVFSEEIPWESIDYPQGLPFAKMDLDESIGKVNVVPQDMMRVLLNLFNNAFYAVHQQKQNALANNDVPSSYTPSVLIRSKRTKKGIEISVKDNGTGMPESVRRFARVSLEQWRFEAQQVNGKPIVTEVGVRFNLSAPVGAPEDFRQDKFERIQQRR